MIVGGAVASWLVRSTPERTVRVRALAGDIVTVPHTYFGLIYHFNISEFE